MYNIVRRYNKCKEIKGRLIEYLWHLNFRRKTYILEKIIYQHKIRLEIVINNISFMDDEDSLRGMLNTIKIDFSYNELKNKLLH